MSAVVCHNHFRLMGDTCVECGNTYTHITHYLWIVMGTVGLVCLAAAIIIREGNIIWNRLSDLYSKKWLGAETINVVMHYMQTKHQHG